MKPENNNNNNNIDNNTNNGDLSALGWNVLEKRNLSISTSTNNKAAAAIADNGSPTLDPHFDAQRQI